MKINLRNKNQQMMTSSQMMLSYFVVILCSSVIPSLSVLPGPVYKATQGDIWPRPFHTLKGPRRFVYDPSKIEFKGEGEKCPLMTNAVMRYRSILQRQARGPLFELGGFTPKSWRNVDELNDLPILKNVVLKMYGKCDIYPYMDMDESYRLNINATIVDDEPLAVIQANSVWGILKGLESFSQLSYFNGTIHQLTVSEVGIWDKPRFPHRGLMIDTARHYLQKKTIKLIIDAMEYNKLNVLHWHVVDDQSFPYKSKLYPKLSEFGAYRPEKIYSEKDIREIIEHARVRGIRVIPEFDTPGHTQSWGLGQPDLLTKCYTRETPNGLYGPIDPSNDANYDFLLQLFKEISQIYPDTHFHFGGDEVDFTCWKSNPNLTEFMLKKGFGSNYAMLQSYYTAKVLDIAKSLKVLPVVWQEVFLNDKNLSTDAIVHVWTGNMKSILNQVTGSGHNTIFSTCWYLDHFKQDLYAGGGDWQDFYSCEPLDFPGTDEMKSKVVGGEACMWAEYVDDTNIIPRVWPRACSAAERLWSSQFDLNLAAHRLEEHVCRMRSRGIYAQPPNGPSTC